MFNLLLTKLLSSDWSASEAMRDQGKNRWLRWFRAVKLIGFLVVLFLSVWGTRAFVLWTCGY